MRIDKVNLRVIKGQDSTEVFMTSDEPLINTLLRLPSGIELESGNYSLSLDKLSDEPLGNFMEPVDGDDN